MLCRIPNLNLECNSATSRSFPIEMFSFAVKDSYGLACSGSTPILPAILSKLNQTTGSVEGHNDSIVI